MNNQISYSDISDGLIVKKCLKEVNFIITNQSVTKLVGLGWRESRLGNKKLVLKMKAIKSANRAAKNFIDLLLAYEKGMTQTDLFGFSQFCVCRDNELLRQLFYRGFDFELKEDIQQSVLAKLKLKR